VCSVSLALVLNGSRLAGARGRSKFSYAGAVVCCVQLGGVTFAEAVVAATA
jgi:hypothetical protein